MPGGRPKITLDDLPDDWEEKMYELAKEGKTVASWCVHALDISKPTFYNLKEREPKFSNAVTRAKTFAQDWWEEKGRANLAERNFHHRLWDLNIRNRFSEDWSDKKNIDITSDGKRLEGNKTVNILGEEAESIRKEFEGKIKDSME